LPLYQLHSCLRVHRQGLSILGFLFFITRKALFDLLKFEFW
jgi:hypothetical protein